MSSENSVISGQIRPPPPEGVQRLLYSQRLGKIVDVVRNRAPSGLILDMGCAQGDLSRKLYAASFSPVIPFDLSRNYLSEVHRHGYGINAVQGHACRLPFKQDRFAVVVCGDIIEHVFNPKKLILEAVRVLQKGGLLVITTPNRKRLFEDHPSYVDSFCSLKQHSILVDGYPVIYNTLGDPHVFLFSSEELLRILRPYFMDIIIEFAGSLVDLGLDRLIRRLLDSNMLSDFY